MNNAEKIEPLMTQMELWSILSNVLNYIQHDRHHMLNQNLSITTVNRYIIYLFIIYFQYLGKSEKTRNDKLRVEGSFPIQNIGIHQADCWMEQNVNCY